MPITNPALAAQVSELVTYWKLRDTEYAEWVAGEATGGPYGDGRYPLTNYLYETVYVKCPAALQASVDSLVEGAAGYAGDAAAALAAALAAKAAAESAVSVATAASTTATTAASTATSAQAYAEASAAAAASSVVLVTSLIDALALGNIPYKNAAETISGAWTFATRPTVGGINVVLASEVPAVTDLVAKTRAVLTSGSITGGGNLEVDRTLSLVNDETSPGALRVYGTDGAGAKGWQAGVFPARLVATASSLTGGGDLSANRTLSLVNDVASPSPSFYYGTDASGTRGWFALPATGVAPSRTVGTDGSLTGGGDLSANRTLSLVNDSASPGSLRVYGTDGSGVKGWLTPLAADGLEIGFRKVPRVASTGETLASSHNGKCLSSTGNVTVPSGVFSAGDAVSIYNNSAGALTITQGAGLTLRLVGTATTGDRTLAQRGLVTLWFESASEAVISGGGLT